jgi:class 3 adenylate cyclase
VTFRARLLQAILGVVALATTASLYVAERQSRTSYGALVDTLFRQQAAAFQREQEGRHALAAEQVVRLATSVRLFAALEEHDREVYKIAGDELRLGDFKAFRLLDPRGAIVAPPADGRAGPLDVAQLWPGLLPARPDEMFADTVELGFAFDPRTSPDRAELFRVLATPIVNFDTRVGTLILVQHLPQFYRQASSENDLQPALWLGGQLLGGEFSPALRDALTEHLADTPTHGDDTEIEVDGTTYRFQRMLLNPGSAYPPAWLVSTFSMATFEARQRELRLRIAFTGLVTALLAAVIGLALARQLARPIGDLVAATRQIRAGNYALSLQPASTREIRSLNEAFDEMAAGLALKDRYRSLLAQVADPQVAAELVAGRVRLGGELRDVTVMFCDIREYTVLTVGRAPEDVIDLLNAHLGTMVQVVHAHGGVINQFAGDSVMALFGAPKGYGDDALRAVRCATAMVHERERMNRTAALPIHIGIGIASGAMVAGCIGAENRSDYTVVGERVNLAARLCGAARAGDILLDENTRLLIGNEIETTAVPPVLLKGFTQPTMAYRVAVEPDTP